MKRSRILNRLPPETVEEIFYKLPVKSLLRFKCVSKSWRSCISSRDFIAEHLNQSNITGTDFTRHKLILTYTNRDYCVSSCCSSCSIGCLLNDNNNDGDYEPMSPSLRSNPSIPIPSLKDNSVAYFNLLGSCNGLTLISINNGELYLWNPSTRKYRNIVNPSRSLHRSIYGFGYDETTDDYKVVCFLSLQVGAEPHQTEIHMYSSVSNSWKKTRDFDRGLLPDGTGKFVNGKLHWLASYKHEDRSTWYIVSLNLVKEYKYRIMPPLDCVLGCGDYPVLDDLGGCLSLIRHDYAIKAMDVWVMKEESCWSKIWTFPDRIGYCRMSCPEPLWLKENGDIVVALGFDIVIYRGKDKLCQYSVDNIFNNAIDMFNVRIEPIVYVESLVSPFPIWGWQL